jgi:preprotein translocase subunit SecG
VYIFLLIVLLLDGILLSVVVLLQSGKGGGLAAMGGAGGTAADSVLGGRQAATLLTKATWTTGGIFIGLALVLSIMSSRLSTPQSILRQEFQSAPMAPQPILPGAESTGIGAPVTPVAPAGRTGAAQPPAGTGGNGN